VEENYRGGTTTKEHAYYKFRFGFILLNSTVNLGLQATIASMWGVKKGETLEFGFRTLSFVFLSG